MLCHLSACVQKRLVLLPRAVATKLEVVIGFINVVALKRNLKGACMKGRVQSRLVNAALSAYARNNSTLSGLGMTQGARAFWTVGLPLFVLTVSGFYGLSHLVQGKFDVQVGLSQRNASAVTFPNVTCSWSSIPTGAHVLC